MYNSKFRRRAFLPVIVGLAAVGSLMGQNPTPENTQTRSPLNRGMRGREVVRSLKDRLPEVARMNGMAEAAVGRLLEREEDLWVDRELRLFYVCDRLETAAVEAVDAVAEAPTAVPNSTDAFKLHSLPGATRVIYLDFDGHVTSNTSWNRNKTGGVDINSSPFDMDGNPSNWSTAELDRIKRIWQRVAEDYMPFAVDVTTEDPGVEALRRADTADGRFGVRVVISPSSAWYGSAGGVAYVGSFMWSSDTPAFVFADKLGPNSEKFIAEAATHEVGHTLGLAHDGKTDGTAYYSGHGNWAPIMGVGYSKAVTHWSKGEYAGANNLEDDLAIMPTYGAPLLADDYGNDLSTTATLTGPAVATLGVIENRSDVDVFRFDSGAGQITLSVSAPGPETNLDAKLEVLSSTGVVLASSDPSGTAASVTLNVAAGTYFARVQGVGFGDPVTTGYSDYGSLGEYQLTGNILSVAPPTVVEWSALDGGFETVSAGPSGYSGFTYTPSYPGYSFTGNAGIAANGSGFTSGNAPAPEGSQVAFVQSRGALSFPVNFNAGTFRVKASIANRANWGTVQSVAVSVDGNPAGTFAAGTSYITVTSEAFTVTAGVHTVTLTGLVSEDATLFLDRLALEPAINAAPVVVATAGFEAPNVGGHNFSAFMYTPGFVAGSQQWQFSGRAGVAGNSSGFTLGNPNAPEGSQVAFLQSNDGVIRQAVNFPATGNYTITVAAANRGQWSTGQQVVEVLIDGFSAGTFSPATTGYQSYTIPFWTGQGAREVTLRGTASADSTALLDQVRIDRVN